MHKKNVEGLNQKVVYSIEAVAKYMKHSGFIGVGVNPEQSQS